MKQHLNFIKKGTPSAFFRYICGRPVGIRFIAIPQQSKTTSYGVDETSCVFNGCRHVGREWF